MFWSIHVAKKFQKFQKKILSATEVFVKTTKEDGKTLLLPGLIALREKIHAAIFSRLGNAICRKQRNYEIALNFLHCRRLKTCGVYPRLLIVWKPFECNLHKLVVRFYVTKREMHANERGFQSFSYSAID